MFNAREFAEKLRKEVLNELSDLSDDLREEFMDLEDEFKSIEKDATQSNSSGWTTFSYYPLVQKVVPDKNQKTTKVVLTEGSDKGMYNSNFNVSIKKEWSFNLPVGRFVSLGCVGITKFIVTMCKDSIVIASSMSRYRFIQNVLSVLLYALIGSIIVYFGRYIKHKKSKIVTTKPKKEISLNVKKNISKEDLEFKLKDLLNEWYDTSGETGKSYPYIEQALRQLKDISTIQSTLSLLVDNNDESSLEEVFNVIKTTEEQVIRNIVSMLNHIKVELSIEGYDPTHIEEYLNSNELLVKECSSLLKTALLYMDGKADSKGIEEYIKSMVETLNRLKKEG